MKALVVGMHRSGTSMLTRCVSMLGANIGDESMLIGTNDENPKGFWERKDVRDLNDFVLHSVGCDWDRVSKFNIENLERGIKEEFLKTAAMIVDSFAVDEDVVLKEPRFCLLLPLWKKVLKDPIYIYIVRNPLEVGVSLNKRNGISISAGIALWEFYNRQAITALEGQRVFLLTHQDLLMRPVSTMEAFASYSESKGFSPDRAGLDNIDSFVDINLYRSKAQLVFDDIMNSKQISLYENLSSLSLNVEGVVFSKEQGLGIEGISHLAKETLKDFDSLYALKEQIYALKDKNDSLNADNENLANHYRSSIEQLESEFGKAFTGIVCDLDKLMERVFLDVDSLQNSTQVYLDSLDKELSLALEELKVDVELKHSIAFETKKCFESVLTSRRYRVGDFVVRIFNAMRLKKMEEPKSVRDFYSIWSR